MSKYYFIIVITILIGLACKSDHNSSSKPLLKKETVRELLSQFLEQIKSKPDDSALVSQIAEAYYQLGRIDTALYFFQRLNEICPKNAVIINQIGNCFTAMGSLKEARFQYKLATNTDPEYYPAFLNLASAYQEQGSIDDAVATYEKTIQLNSDYWPAYYNMAILRFQQKQYQLAGNYFSQALDKLKDYDVPDSVRLKYQSFIGAKIKYCDSLDHASKK